MLSTENSTQPSAITSMAKESENNRYTVSICITESDGCTPKTNTTLYVNYIPTYHKNEITKSKAKQSKAEQCLLYSPLASLTWAGNPSLEPEQAWVPRLDCGLAERAGEDVPTNEPLL